MPTKKGKKTTGTAEETTKPHVYNGPTFAVTNDAARDFINDIHKNIKQGYGFVPFIGAGLSAPSGIPLVWEIESYLHRCIGLALGVSTPDIEPWNPRTHQWPPFENRGSRISGTWRGLIQDLLDNATRRDSWHPEIRVFQEAHGAMAEWRSALQFLARIVYDRRGTGRDRRGIFVLDAPRQDVIDSAIREIMRGKKPTLGHRMLASLGGLLRLDIILTTNFDDLLEQAFLAARNPLTAFSLHLASDLPPYAALAPQRSLVKLHGDRHSMRADYTLDSVPQDADCWRFLEYLLSADGRTRLAAGPRRSDSRLPAGHHLLVMGFSASERRTRTLIEHAWKHLSGFTVYWLCHTITDVQNVIAFTNEARPDKPSTQSRILRHTNLGLLFLQLFQTIRGSVPTSGIIFPSASRLALPPISKAPAPASLPVPRAVAKKNKLLEQAVAKKAELLELLASRLKRFATDSRYQGCRLMVVTSEHNVDGVTSLCSELFELAQADGQFCVWLEMNDVSSTDDLFEQILDATNYRLGAENWMPVFVASDPASRADEIRRLIASTTKPWVFFLNARETPGSNFSGDDDRARRARSHNERPNGWLDDRAAPSQATKWNEQEQFVGLISALCKRGPADPVISIVLLTHGKEGTKTVEGNINDAIKEATLVADVDVLPATSVPYVASTIPLNCIKWTRHPNHETNARRHFLLGLVLMQRTRFLASLWCDALLPAGGTSSDTTPDEAMRTRAITWLDELEDKGLVRRKLGGFVWVRADSRNELRRYLRNQTTLTHYLRSEGLSQQGLAAFSDWHPENLVSEIHWRLALWYRRIMTAAETPGALFESVYHACKSAESLLTKALSRAKAAQAAERLNWGTAVLQAYGFMIQTRGYSKGSCRRLDDIRKEKAAMISVALEKAAQSSRLRRAVTGPWARVVEQAILRLQIRCTELMRAIAREVGEGNKAYERHRTLRLLLSGEQRYALIPAGQQAKGGQTKRHAHIDPLLEWKNKSEVLFSRFFIQPLTKSTVAVEDRPVEWMRYWRWCGMLGTSSRSFIEARRALLLGVVSALKGPSLPGRIESFRTVHSASRRTTLQNMANGFDRAAQLLRADGTGAVKLFDVRAGNSQAFGVELLRTGEQLAACLLHERSAYNRCKALRLPDVNDPHEYDPVEGPRHLREVIQAALALVERILSEDHATDAPHIGHIVWCHSRLLLHASMCVAREGRDYAAAMRLLTDAEASTTMIDARRYGSDRALVELYRAEVRLQEALNTPVIIKRGGTHQPVEFSVFIEDGMMRTLSSDALDAWQVRGMRLRKSLFADDESVRGFQQVKSLVRDAIRFIDRADDILSSRRRNVTWTTWHFHRRLQAMSVFLWATVFEQGTVVPFFGYEAAPANTNTVADDVLATSLRMIRADSYRLATIVEAYSSCAQALHYRLMLDPMAPRLEERQVRMRDKLKEARVALDAMHESRCNAHKVLLKDTQIDQRMENKIGERVAPDPTVRAYVEKISDRTREVIKELKSPLI